MGKELQRVTQVNSRTGEIVEAGVDLSELAERLVATATAEGVELTGPNGLLTGLTRQVLQSALEAELANHLGYDRYAVDGRGSGNSRNGTTPKTVRTEIGEVTVQVPRDRAGTFEPRIVAKHQRRLDGFDKNVLSLYAKGMTTGDIAAHLAELYGDEVSRDLVSTVTDRIVEEMAEWQARPLEPVYPVILIDAIMMKIRAGTVGNRPVYVAMGIDLDGHRDVLGMWVGPTGGEGAKQWMNMLTELRNRGVQDVIVVCCDGLKGLPESIRATWPQTTVQTCVVHLVRNSLRFASKKHWKRLSGEIKEIYHAPTVAAAETRFAEFADEWTPMYPAMVEMWRRAWGEFTPFLEFPLELRKIVYTTNAIESLNARFRQAVRRRGHFPNEQSAMKVLYLVAKQRQHNRQNPTGETAGWKGILNVLAMTYGDRLGLN
ncbi:IS256 family transposase [Microbacterium fluvii]|uniref:Mutator family transposase n=1 Tax=Microbacterium fluvii TaxID=415215 RepID=A0ABW2HJF5_9MICO|nr:IS256 family transposase [Microbacterium fluvii]MCU4673753.1 IS256 family transposase [Microbacterium fluvii]